MRKWFCSALLVLPLAAAGGLVYAVFQGQQPQPASTQGYVCPITGEELPCALCCPLNGDYVCPMTGEKLPCALCCPLNGDTNCAAAKDCPVTK